MTEIQAREILVSLILPMAVILSIQQRPPRNFKFQNIAQSWQVNFMNAS